MSCISEAAFQAPCTGSKTGWRHRRDTTSQCLGLPVDRGKEAMGAGAALGQADQPPSPTILPHFEAAVKHCASREADRVDSH